VSRGLPGGRGCGAGGRLVAGPATGWLRRRDHRSGSIVTGPQAGIVWGAYPRQCGAGIATVSGDCHNRVTDPGAAPAVHTLPRSTSRRTTVDPSANVTATAPSAFKLPIAGKKRLRLLPALPRIIGVEAAETHSPC
jgi:hypothetical protein